MEEAKYEDWKSTVVNSIKKNPEKGALLNFFFCKNELSATKNWFICMFFFATDRFFVLCSS